MLLMNMKISKSLSNISIIAVHDENVLKFLNSLLMWCYFVDLVTIFSGWSVLGVGGRIRYWLEHVEDGYETTVAYSSRR